MEIFDLYRVLDPDEEPKGKILTSDKLSTFRKEVLAYNKLSCDIYNLALKTGMTILNAVRVAENVPCFLESLNDFFNSNKKNYNLQEMLIQDPVEYISKDALFDFTNNYIHHINETGLFYDYGHNNYIWDLIWEVIRMTEFPLMPSRMKSLFLFDSQQIAMEFMRDNRSPKYKLVKVDLINGQTHKFDMNWFSVVPCKIPLSEAQEYARNYWGQKQTTNPTTEVLFQGEYVWHEIINT